MINFFYEVDMAPIDQDVYDDWIKRVIDSENCRLGEINFIFCDDEYLNRINQEYLAHNTYTDIISFDTSIGKELNGDIFVSEERVRDNANKYKVAYQEELRRVVIHGVLHFCGYDDKEEKQSKLMRLKEDEKLRMFDLELK